MLSLLKLDAPEFGIIFVGEQVFSCHLAFLNFLAAFFVAWLELSWKGVRKMDFLRLCSYMKWSMVS